MRTFLIMLFSAILCVQPISAYLEERVGSLETQVTDLSKMIEKLNDKKEEQGDTNHENGNKDQSNSSEEEAAAVGIGEELKRLTGEMEKLRHELDLMKKQLETIPGMAKIEKGQIVPPVTGIDSVLGSAKTVEEAMATQQAIAGTPKLPEGDLQAQYDQIISFVNKKAYPQAEQAAKYFIDTYSENESAKKGGLINKAKYWHAESLFNQKKTDDALTAIKSGFSYPHQNPVNDKKPEYLLLLSKTLVEQGKQTKQEAGSNTKACTVLKEALEKFPQMAPQTKEQIDQQKKLLQCK